MSSSRPSIAEIRAVCQPTDVMQRVNAEHWAGRLYGRRISAHLTRLLITLGVAADAVTWAMISAGFLAGAILSVGGWWTAAACVVLIQFQLVLDCSDGEVARWRGSSSAVGIYLDRIGHYLTEVALVSALGVRCSGGWSQLDGWATLGCAVAVAVSLIKAETDLVDVARARAGLPVRPDTQAIHRNRRLAGTRSVLRFLPFYRAFVAVEFSLLTLLAATADAVTGSLTGSRALLAVLVPVAVVVLIGHLISVIGSNRLR